MISSLRTLIISSSFLKWQELLFQESRKSFVSRYVLVFALLLVSGPSTALTDDCPSFKYLGDNPANNDNTDWSESAQGIANDGEFWFFTDKTQLFKYHANWRPTSGADAGKIHSVGFPPELSDIGINHFGDLDHYAGYLFVPFEKTDTWDVSIIGVFRASDLKFVDWVDVNRHQKGLGWVAIHPVEKLLYSSVGHLEAGTPLLGYKLDITKIENNIKGDFLILDDTSPLNIPVIDNDGSPLAGKYSYMQGGVFNSWGDLYISSGRINDPREEDVIGGLHLFRRASGESAFRRIESSANEEVEPGAEGFFYPYKPSLLRAQEPEGIDWWNRDNIPDSLYEGQLHAILLKQEASDDSIWLKHNMVDYSCVRDESPSWVLM